MIKVVKICLVVALSVNIISCVTTSGQNNTNEYFDSSAVTVKVKHQLKDKLGAQSSAIKVKSYRDEVQLTGVVKSATAKQLAGEVAATIGDVKYVRNDIMLG